jgi:diguanylate cyclase (GGDEF)-like protein
VIALAVDPSIQYNGLSVVFLAEVAAGDGSSHVFHGAEYIRKPDSMTRLRGNFTFLPGAHYTESMVKSAIQEKNIRIMKMVVLLIWLEVFVITVLGIAFPMIYVNSMKAIYLKEQGVTLKVSREFMEDFLTQRGAILSISAKHDILDMDELGPLVRPELHGLPENAAPDVRKYFQDLLKQYESFRFFAFLTPDTVQPVMLQPYAAQESLTDEQFAGGYAWRPWAQKTLENYVNWDGNGFLRPYVSDAFLSQPGNIPAISLSVGVVGPNKNLEGILYVNMTLEKVRKYAEAFKYGKTGKIYFVDSDGHLLAHPDMASAIESKDEKGNAVWALRNVGDNPMVARALKGEFVPGLYRIPGTGKLVLATYGTMPSTGWVIVVEQDAAEAFSLVRAYVIAIIALVLLTIVSSFSIFMYISREIAVSEREHLELVVISETDPLTGLLNRRSMLSRMSQIIDNSEETGQGFVLAMFDIDDFKAVNDTYGHVFGDIVLREIAARTVSILRVEDLLFRWGGEEFLLILKNCDLVRGRGVAEKIRRVVGDTPISDGLISQTVTVTIGVCQYRKGSIDSMVIAADEALYAGKRAGKNRVVVSEG